MNGSTWKKLLPQALAWAALVVFCGVPQAQGQSTQGQRTDGQIEMDVVHALDASTALKDDMITAATIQGEVSLSGTVSSQGSKDLAQSICLKVAGVTKVNNNLKVGNPQDAQLGDNAGQQADNNPPDDAAQPYAPADNQSAQNSGQQYPNQQNPNQQYPTQQYPNPQYPNQQYPNQGQQAQAPYPPSNPQYGSAPYPPQYPSEQRDYGQAPGPRYDAPRGPVTIPPGVLLEVRTNETLDNKWAKEGSPVQFTVIRDVAVQGVLAIPKGATVHGVVIESHKAGDLGGNAQLALRLTSLDLGGRSYELDSDVFRVQGPSKTGQTVGNAVGGGILGAIIGCAVGRGAGCAVGAGAGVAAGLGASAASSGPRAWIPAEALVTFHVNTPLTVDPVSEQEASRLAQGLYSGGPNLYHRPPYGPGPRYAAPYPYAYGPVYYRPYYVTGGVYYWR